jgi:tryptophan synthase alpha chain
MSDSVSKESLAQVFARSKSENRAALIAYMPAGFPTLEGSKRLIEALIAGGVDIVEVGFAYSDPVMDGAIIQQAAEIALRNKTGAKEVLEVVASVTVPTLVMSYWNPIERYGVEQFTASLASAGGVGVITPDLTIEESATWIQETERNNLQRVYVVAPSTDDSRLAKVASQCSGFVYAASLMGVTGARSSLSDSASELVARLRKVTDLPIAVGLGVSTAEQAANVAKFADGVIVGSAFIKLVLEAADITQACKSVTLLAQQLSAGVRQGQVV